MSIDSVALHIASILEDPFVRLVQQHVAGVPVRIFVVGGTIRDVLLRRPLIDHDFVVQGDTQGTAKMLAERLGASYVPLEKQWDMSRVVLQHKERSGKTTVHYLDFSALRGATIHEDLLQRDFTINAMALDLAQEAGSRSASLIDPTGGYRDIEHGIIKMVHPKNVQSDPVRILRAFRFSSTLGFTISSETERTLSEFAGSLWTSAGERIQEELIKLMSSPSSFSAISHMDRCGILAVLFPELLPLRGLYQGPKHHEDAWCHTLSSYNAFEELAKRDYLDLCPWDRAIRKEMQKKAHVVPLIKLGLLFHDVGKATTHAIGNDGHPHFYGHDREGAKMTLDLAKRLRLSRMDQHMLWNLVKYHMWPLHLYKAASMGRMSDRAVIRFFRRLGSQAPAVLLLSLADATAKSGQDPSKEHIGPFERFIVSLLDVYYRKDAAGIRLRPLLNGRDIIEHLGLPEGPMIGRLLEAVHEARVSGKVQNRTEALEFVRSLIHKV